MKRWAKTLACAAILSGVHGALYVYCLGKALYPNSAEDAAPWQAALGVLGFPFVYVERLHYRRTVPAFLNFDWLPFLIGVNSLVWGVGLTLLVAWLLLRSKTVSRT
jgi:hypothetical protein